MKSVLEKTSCGWTLNRAIGLDPQDRSPVAPRDLPTTIVFSEPVRLIVPALANATPALDDNAVVETATPHHVCLRVTALTEMAVFTGTDVLTIASNPPLSAPIAWRPVVLEPTAAAPPAPPAGYGVVLNPQVRTQLNLGPVPAGHNGPDVSVAWSEIIARNEFVADFGGRPLLMANPDDPIHTQGHTQAQLVQGQVAAKELVRRTGPSTSPWPVVQLVPLPPSRWLAPLVRVV